MDDALDKTRIETVAKLEAALQELEAGEELTYFVGGHGLQSRLFVFAWQEPALDINVRIPYARVLNDEETQAEEQADVGAMLRLTRLLLLAAVNGSLLQEGEAALFVSLNELGGGYRVVDADGATLDAGDDWTGLIARLEAACPDDAASVHVIWP